MSCSDEKDLLEPNPGSPVEQKLEIDMEELALFGPDYVNRIFLLNLPQTYSLPNYVNSITFYPDERMIAPEGQQVFITADGTFSHILLKATDFVTGQDIATTTIIGNGYSGGAGILTIPEYRPSEDMYEIRFIEINYWNEIGYWMPFYYFSQVGIVSNKPFSAKSNIEGLIPAAGGNYIISIQGNHPGIESEYVAFRAIDQSGVQVGNISIIANIIQKSVDFVIPQNNSGQPLELSLQYSFNMITWETFEEHTQSSLNGGVTDPTPDDNQKLSTGRYIAKRDALYEGLTGNEKLNWAIAAGVDIAENNRYTNYVTVAITNPTGCNAYYEKGNKSDLGKWYLPSREELEEVFYDQRYFGLYPDSYWSWTPPVVGDTRYCYALYYNANAPVFHSMDKSDAARVRCVYGAPTE